MISSLFLEDLQLVTHCQDPMFVDTKKNILKSVIHLHAKSALIINRDKHNELTFFLKCLSFTMKSAKNGTNVQDLNIRVNQIQ